MSLTLVTPPAVLPVTEAEVWDHLRVPLLGSPAAPVDQAHILTLIRAIVGWLDGKDGILGRALVTQTWDLKMDAFPGCRTSETGYCGSAAAADAIRVPLPPLQSVTSIGYVDSAGATQTLAASKYTVDTASLPARIVPVYGETWPSTRDEVDAVTVRFVAGYAGDGASPEDLRANVPTAIKQAIKILVAEAYQHREASVVGQAVAAMPFAAQALLAPYRVWDA